MRWQLPLVSSLFLLGLAGCANLHINEPLDSSVSAASDQAFIYGRFDEIKGSLNISSLWIRIENVESGNTFEIQVEDGIHVFAVDPGTYRLSEFLTLAGGVPKSMLTAMDVRSTPIVPVQEPFRVEAGHAYYLGDFVAHSDNKFAYWENTLKSQSDTFAETTAEIRQIYPGLSNLEFEITAGVGPEIEHAPLADTTH